MPNRIISHHDTCFISRAKGSVYQNIYAHQWQDFEPSKQATATNIIISVHGLFGSRYSTEKFVDTLINHLSDTENNMIISFDLPGHGFLQEKTNQLPSMDCFEDYLIKVMEWVNATYHPKKVILFGHCFGGSIILSAIKKLEDYQEKRKNLLGSILISPAIQDKCQSFFFQRRPLAYPWPLGSKKTKNGNLTLTNLYHRLYEVPQMVNQVFDTALPYSANTNLKLIIFVASKDMFVTKATILKWFNSVKHNDNVSFFAFPARHSILITKPECGLYIDGQTVIKDVAAIIQALQLNQFDKRQRLMHTGAREAQSMLWYQQAYETNLFPSGYVSSWTTANNTAMQSLLNHRSNYSFFFYAMVLMAAFVFCYTYTSNIAIPPCFQK